MNVPVTEKDNLSQYMISCPKKLCSIKISCDKFQISCLQCRHVDGDLRGLVNSNNYDTNHLYLASNNTQVNFLKKNLKEKKYFCLDWQ